MLTNQARGYSKYELTKTSLYKLLPTKFYDEVMSEKESCSPADGEITVIEDEKGLALFGDPHAIEDWLGANGVASQPIGSAFNKAIHTAGVTTTEAMNLVEQSGRWVKLTKESAALAKATNATSGVARASNGQIIKHLKFAQVGGLFTPAGAAVLGSILAQKALEQSISEISEYLEVIDAKIDDLIQDQKDNVIAELFSLRHAIEEAYIIREETGFVSSITWSKVASRGADATRVQKYALQKIQGLTQKIQTAKTAADLRTSTGALSGEIAGWLVALGNAVMAQDQLAVIELDRVLEESPEALEQHREGLKLARNHRIAEIESTLLELGNQLGPAWKTAQEMQLRNPITVKRIFEDISAVDKDLDTFAQALELQENSWSESKVFAWKVVAGAKVTEKIDGFRNVARKIPKVEVKLKQRDSE